ncbi:caspase family protein [Streptomyces sp. NPDC059340]|uniref:caspase family protein n=1 Tax=Streptomyces sp. NPDC059340 TaxID=3346806 RepID=UPI0036B5C34D
MKLKGRPDRTYAVLVGIDTYASPRLPPLNGPALDACRHAGWLRSKGVPTTNIRLLVSPGEQSRVRVAAIAEELGLASRPATQAEVERVLVDELPEWRGDLLWFAWSGHGILDDRDQQRLFCADARPTYEVNLPMGEFERTLLHDRRYEGIREKICVVDACRDFDVPASSLPGTLSFGRTDTPDSQGYLQSAYATQDGRPAVNLGAEGRGLFTSHLLDELERSQAWPPDLPRVLETVKARMGAVTLADRVG